MRPLPILLMVTAGFLVAFQGPVNSRLRLAAESPVLSAAVSFLTGGLILLLIAASGNLGGFGAGGRGLASAPWWAYLGGMLGITFVLVTILALPVVGTLTVICAATLGQMLGSVLVDAFGWFGVPRIPPNPLRLLGLVVIFIGVLLVQKR